MILQQAPASAHLFGKSSSTQITVTTFPIIIKSISTKVDPSTGQWSLYLPPTASTNIPFNISITSSTDSITLTDIYFGEVWICGGQSNMALTLSGVGAGKQGHLPATSWSGVVTDGQQEIRNSTKYPLIRIKQQGASSSCLKCVHFLDRQRCSCNQEQTDTNASSRWSIPSPTTISSFSATCWMFGRRLHTTLNNVPLGLIEIAVGGTSVELWSSSNALSKCNQQRTNRMATCQDPSNSSMRTETTYTNSTLFNMMTAPYMKMAVQGIVWYQGESNVACNSKWPYFQGKNCAMNPIQCSNYYACQFSAMIDDYRERLSKPWKNTNKNVSFVFVQLPAYIEDLESVSYGGINDTSLPLQRLAQAKAVAANKSSFNRMVSIVDRGWLSSHYGSIHPMDKTPVGQRLMLGALEVAYPNYKDNKKNKKIRSNGPIVANVSTINESTLLVTFINLGANGLLLRTSGSVRQVCPVGEKQTTVLPVKPTTGVPIQQCGSPSGFEVTFDGDGKDGVDRYWIAVENISLFIGNNGVLLHNIDGANRVTGVRYLFSDWPIVTVYDAESFLGVNGQLPAAPFEILMS